MIELKKDVKAIGRDFATEGQVEVYRFPNDWAIREYFLQERKGLTQEEIKAVVTGEFPYKGGTSSLRTLARGKTNAVILIDDLTRPTPSYEIVPHLLELLTEAGIAEDQISFVFAFGTHRPLTEEEWALKIGRDTLRKYRVENHDAFKGDFADLGHTSYGTHVKVNRKVVEADLVVTVGTLAKHRFVYACGGSKIILPGVSHVDTILQNHKGMANVQRGEGQKFGKTRLGMNEVARMVAERTELVVIDVTVNRLREVTGIYMGDCVDVFTAKVDEALETYVVEFDRNDYGPSGKADIGFFRMGFHSIDPLQLSRSIDMWEEVCDTPVMVADCRDRYLYDGKRDGPFEAYLEALKEEKAELSNPPLEKALKPKGFAEMIVYSPYLDPKSTHLKLPHMYVANDWESLIKGLYKYLGPDQKVAFFHDASVHLLDVK